MENSFLFTIMPAPLRATLLDAGAASVVQQVLVCGFEMQDDATGVNDHASIQHLSLSIAQMLIHAVNPIAQTAMENMCSADRCVTMSWLSNPEPIANALSQMINQVVEDTAIAAQITESAYALAAEIPEVAGLLQDDAVAQGLRDGTFVEELQMLRDGTANAPESAAVQRERARLAERIAGAASDTAQRAVISAPLGGTAAASSASSAAGKQPVSRALSHVRSSCRLKARQRSDPLEVLDEDALRLILAPLPPPALKALHQASRQWAAQVKRVVRSKAWRDSYQCLYPSSLCKLVTESGVARLDLGREGITASGYTLHDAEATGSASAQNRMALVFRRLDGPSIGPISADHIVGIFCECDALSWTEDEVQDIAESRAKVHRLDLVKAPFKPQVAAKESPTTQLVVQPLSKSMSSWLCGQAGTSRGKGRAVEAEGPLCYEESFGIFDRNAQIRLRLGMCTVRESWASRLRLAPVGADAAATASLAK